MFWGKRRRCTGCSGWTWRTDERTFAGGSRWKHGGIPSQPVDATRLIVTDDFHQNAHPDLEATRDNTRQVLEPLFEGGLVPVVTGFIAATPKGTITTLGRGGSDYSAGILGAVLPADEVWIWTDVDGVMSADPRAVPEAPYDFGAVLPRDRRACLFRRHGAAPKDHSSGVGGRNRAADLQHVQPFPSRDTAGERPPSTQDGVIKAVTVIQAQRLVTIEGRGMLGVPGVAGRAFAAVASTGTSVALITQASSEQSICFTAPASSADGVIAALKKTFANELAQRDIDRIWATDEVVIVTVVGAGMIRTPGIAGRIFGGLGKEGVNVIAIAQGSTEVSISLVVEAQILPPPSVLCTN